MIGAATREVPTKDHAADGMYVLKKKNDDDLLFSGITKTKGGKRGKRDKKRSQTAVRGVLCEIVSCVTQLMKAQIFCGKQICLKLC